MTTEKRREYERKWRADNSERVKANRHKNYLKNKARHAETTRAYAEAHPEKMKAGSQKHQLKKYGLTPEDRARMLAEQNGRCGICQCEEGTHKYRMHVDHNHVTNQVRGLLCHHCNTGIGFFRDDPRLLARAIKYLKAERTAQRRLTSRSQ